MKLSLHTAQWYSSAPLASNGVAALVEAIGLQLGAIEDVQSWGELYEGVVLAKVISCEQHPNADKLKVCTIDDGGVVKDVVRNDDNTVTVVCGAPNVAADQMIVWIPLGAVVPQSVIADDPFRLTAKELRGVVSNGMIASRRELLISDEHDGILVIDESDVGGDLYKIGTPFVNLFGLNDTIIDLENKMFTHRPDCFGALGVARELAAIQGIAFTSPEWYQSAIQHDHTEDLPVKVQVDSDSNVQRFLVQTVKGVSVGSSPVWMQSLLQRVGIKPINNIVDITNYIMYLTAQPLHAYDYDKVKKYSNNEATLVVRNAVDGEKITLLGGKDIALTTEDSVIATDKTVIGLAGVMGGADTEVDKDTTNIILECGTFDMYAIRRTSMRHGLFTEAVTRFNKGQSPLQNDRVVGLALKDILKYAGGDVASSLFDFKSESVTDRPTVKVSSDYINTRLGSSLSAAQMAQILHNAEFIVEIDNDQLSVQSPFWRMDVEIAEDVIEEVGRLYGFHKLPVVLPSRPASPVPRNELRELKYKARSILSALGGNEILSYSFVKGSLIESAQQDIANAYQIRNALSPDLQYYRLSLTPSILERVRPNIKAGNKVLNLFEINSVHSNIVMDPHESELPKEQQLLAMVHVFDQTYEPKESIFYVASKWLRTLAGQLGIELEFQVLTKNETDLDSVYLPGRAALVYLRGTRNVIGVVGEIKPEVIMKLRLPACAAAFELRLEELVGVQGKTNYSALSKFPSSDRDLTIRVYDKFTFEQIIVVMQQSRSANDIINIEPISIYRADNNDVQRNLTFRLVFVSERKTLTAEEVSQQMDALTKLLTDKFEAEII